MWLVVRQQLLMQEYALIERNLLSIGSNGSEFALDELLPSYPNLHNAYHQLFVYYQRRNTLPSLVSWSAEYRALVSHMIATFEQALQQISLSRALTTQENVCYIWGFVAATIMNVFRLCIHW